MSSLVARYLRNSSFLSSLLLQNGADQTLDLRYESALDAKESPEANSVLEDYVDLREIIARWLADQGAIVDEAGTIATARGALSRRPALVRLDLHLGTFNTLGLAKEILTAASPPTVIAMSGGATDAQRRQLKRLGAQPFLPKPFSMQSSTARTEGTRESR
jgi:DNA-binding response OmpR family regulator